MPMTPVVAAARQRHKIKNTLESLSAAAILLLLCAAFIWGLFSSASQWWEQQKADNEFRHTLVVASGKSTAHHFLVINWFQCTPLLQTRAGCYASIRGAAASRGEAFVRQVDAAANELGLLI